jgi:hypothetical protein
LWVIFGASVAVLALALAMLHAERQLNRGERSWDDPPG